VAPLIEGFPSLYIIVTALNSLSCLHMTLQNRDVRNEYNDQRRVIALLGDFARLETASVQWLNPDRLGQTGALLLGCSHAIHQNNFISSLLKQYVDLVKLGYLV
jgi:hypothetical protein